MDLLGGEDVIADAVDDRLQQPDRLADPIAQGRAVEVEAVAGIDLALPVQRQMIAIFETSRCASMPGAARPRGVGSDGAGAWVIASQRRQAYFGRTCRITRNRPGT